MTGKTICAQTQVLAREFHRADDSGIDSPEFTGISPSELDQKLSHLLFEQQESQIVELESELQQTHSKLYEKEAELQALKDCVRRLTEFSLGSASGKNIIICIVAMLTNLVPFNLYKLLYHLSVMRLCLSLL